jgi:hypothetical protein
MALTEHCAIMLNRERSGFNADPLGTRVRKVSGPKSDNLSFNMRPPGVRLVADARLQPTSGGEAIPTKSVISHNVLACGFKRTHKPMRAQEAARQSVAGR